MGDSSTGKTYIISLLRLVKRMSEIKFNCTHDLRNVFLVSNGLEAEAIYNKRNSIIFLDNLYMYVNDKLKDFINNSNNHFVIMYRVKITGLYATISDFF